MGLLPIGSILVRQSAVSGLVPTRLSPRYPRVCTPMKVLLAQSKAVFCTCRSIVMLCGFALGALYNVMISATLYWSSFWIESASTMTLSVETPAVPTSIQRDASEGAVNAQARPVSATRTERDRLTWDPRARCGPPLLSLSLDTNTAQETG